MNHVYFDRSLASFASILHLVKHSKLNQIWGNDLVPHSFVQYLCLLGYTSEQTKGAPVRRGIRFFLLRNPEEIYFAELVELPQDVMIDVLQATELICSGPCKPSLQMCSSCSRCDTKAEEYGIYDLFEFREEDDEVVVRKV